MSRFSGSVLALVLAGCVASAQDEPAPDPLHGAQPMDQQRARVQELIGTVDLAVSPPGVDPVIWAASIPEDNALTPERVALGRALYFETRLSSDGTVACATCHDVSKGFTDQKVTSEGVQGLLGQRNSPTTLNAMLLQTQFLDGRAPSLEEQAKLPVTNPVEMGMPSGEEAIARIAEDPEYQRMFREAYGRDPNFEDFARAVASFERTLVFLDAPFDRFLKGDAEAIPPEARQGWVLFNGKARCNSCHQISPANPLGTDHQFHNIGVSARAQDFEKMALDALVALEGKGVEAVDSLAIETDLSELGRFLVTKDRSDIGTFKTSQLRNVGITPPYMHDGSMPTLWDVMDHYNRGGEPNTYLDGGIEPLALTEEEIDAVVALMFTMTDDRFAEQNDAERERQRALANEERPFRDEDRAFSRILPFETRVLTPAEEG